MNFAINQSIRGVRGFIIKALDTPERLQKMFLRNNQSFWPYKESDHAKSPWVSIHFEYGVQPWFEKNRTEYDTDANENKCFNIFPFCGPYIN